MFYTRHANIIQSDIVRFTDTDTDTDTDNIKFLYQLMQCERRVCTNRQTNSITIQVYQGRVVNTSNLLEYCSIIARNILPRPLVEQFPIKIRLKTRVRPSSTQSKLSRHGQSRH